MEELFRFAPFVAFELPFLTRRHDAHDPVPDFAKRMCPPKRRVSLGREPRAALKDAREGTHQASAPLPCPASFSSASTESTTKYLACLVSIPPPDEARAWFTWTTSSARYPLELPRAASDFACSDGTNLASCKNSLTLCIVINAVDEGEIMMIGFNCFFFEDDDWTGFNAPGCALAVVGFDEEDEVFMTDPRTLRRGAMRARTESKFWSTGKVSVS